MNCSRHLFIARAVANSKLIYRQNKFLLHFKNRDFIDKLYANNYVPIVYFKITEKPWLMAYTGEGWIELNSLLDWRNTKLNYWFKKLHCIANIQLNKCKKCNEKVF